jgi:hypothetical protein
LPLGKTLTASVRRSAVASIGPRVARTQVATSAILSRSTSSAPRTSSAVARGAASSLWCQGVVGRVPEASDQVLMEMGLAAPDHGGEHELGVDGLPQRVAPAACAGGTSPSPSGGAW